MTSPYRYGIQPIERHETIFSPISKAISFANPGSFCCIIPRKIGAPASTSLHRIVPGSSGLPVPTPSCMGKSLGKALAATLHHRTHSPTWDHSLGPAFFFRASTIVFILNSRWAVSPSAYVASTMTSVGTPNAP